MQVSKTEACTQGGDTGEGRLDTCPSPEEFRQPRHFELREQTWQK